jgi:hypothetical protein
VLALSADSFASFAAVAEVAALPALAAAAVAEFAELVAELLAFPADADELIAAVSAEFFATTASPSAAMASTLA